MFAVFKKRDFTLLWFAQLISTSGSALTDLAAGILIYRATGSALAVGLMLMATALPTLVVGLIAGVFVDRYDRKKIMIVTCLLRAVLVASIPAIVAININLLYVVVLINAGINQFFDPAQESVIPDVATDEELAAANSFLSIAASARRRSGSRPPACSHRSRRSTLRSIVDALTFLFSAGLILLRHRAPDRRRGGHQRSRRDRRPERWLQVPVVDHRSCARFISGVPAFFSFGLWNVLLLPFAITILGATEFEYGLQEGLTSVGFVVGSLFMARFTDRLRERQWIVIGMLGDGRARHPVRPGDVDPRGDHHRDDLRLPQRASRHRPAPDPPAQHAARDARPRVLSTFCVMRDVIFLIGMVAAGLADYVDIRLLVIISGVILVGTGIWTQFLPGLGEPLAEWRQAAQRLRTATAGAAFPSRPLAADDLGVLVGLIPAFGVLGDNERRLLLSSARVRDVPAGTMVVAAGDKGDVGVLDPRPVGPLRARRSRAASTARCRRCSRATCSARSPR